MQRSKISLALISHFFAIHLSVSFIHINVVCTQNCKKSIYMHKKKTTLPDFKEPSGCWGNKMLQITANGMG